MFGFGKIKKLELDLAKSKMDLHVQSTQCVDLLRENARLTQRLRQSELEITKWKRQVKFPPAFQEGAIVGNIKILEIKEIQPNEMSSWVSCVCGLAGVALFLASACLLAEAECESEPETETTPRYKYQIYDEKKKTERTVTEEEFCRMVKK